MNFWTNSLIMQNTRSRSEKNCEKLQISKPVPQTQTNKIIIANFISNFLRDQTAAKRNLKTDGSVKYRSEWYKSQSGTNGSEDSTSKFDMKNTISVELESWELQIGSWENRTLYWELSSSLSSGISPFLVVEKYLESWPLISVEDLWRRRQSNDGECKTRPWCSQSI